MISRKLFAVTALTTSMFLTGCASIVSDSQHPVSLQTSPDGASFTVEDKNGIVVHKGSTPATLSLKSSSGFFSGASYKVTFQKEGYDPVVTTVESKLDGWYIGNILLGGIIGMLIVDPITGAMWELPETASASLQKKLATKETPEGQLQVVSLDKVPSEYQDQMVRLN